MKRSNIWYGYFTWVCGWTGGISMHKHGLAGAVIAVGGYAVLVLSSKSE